MSTFAVQLKTIQSHPRFSTNIFSEFEQIAATYSDAELLEYSLPMFCLPDMSDQVIKNMELQEMATNSWLMSHKPKFLIDLRLRLFTSSIEGQLKILFDILSDWLVAVHSIPARKQDTLGAVFKHIEGSKNLLPANTLAYINGFSNIIEIRNAISHNSYLICIETVPLTPNQLVSIIQSKLSAKALIIFNTFIAGVHPANLGKTLKITELIGKIIGFKPDISVLESVDNNKSNVVYENYPPGKWKPITKTSPTISLSDLTKALNTFDEFSFAAFFGLMAEFDRRFQAGNYLEHFCGCKAANYMLAGTANYDCWYCGAHN